MYQRIHSAGNFTDAKRAAAERFSPLTHRPPHNGLPSHAFSYFSYFGGLSSNKMLRESPASQQGVEPQDEERCVVLSNTCRR